MAICRAAAACKNQTSLVAKDFMFTWWPLNRVGGNCQLRLSGDSNEIASFYFILFYFSETSFQLASGNSKMFFLNLPFYLGEDGSPIWRPHFSDGLVNQPATNWRLYQRVAELAGKPTDKFVLPVPAFNVPQLSVAKRWLRNGWR